MNNNIGYFLNYFISKAKIPKIIIVFFLYSISSLSYATDFSVKLWSALSGTSDHNIYYFYQYLSENYGKPPIKRKDSFWFYGEKNFYGVSVDATFISNGTSDYNFIGLLLNGNPNEVAERLGNTLGVNFTKVNEKYKYSTYNSIYGTELLWEGSNKTKLVYKIKNSKYKFNN